MFLSSYTFTDTTVLFKKVVFFVVFQVEGAVTRAYNRWIEDLSSLPEFQASFKTEKEKWEKLQEEITRQKVDQNLLKCKDIHNTLFSV